LKAVKSNKHITSEEVSEGRYFLGLFTAKSWTEFKANGGGVMGFTEKKVVAAARLQPGDRLLCYLVKRSTFVAVLEVTGPSFFDQALIWTDGLFPVRLPVKVVAELSPLAGLPVHLLIGKLSFLPGPSMPNNWTVHVRSSPRLWRSDDGLAVVSALQARIDRSTAPLGPDLPGQRVDTSMLEASRKRPKFSVDSRVGKLMGRANDLRGLRAVELLEGTKAILSFNKVTGNSVNFPISETCRPTAVCLKYCYFAKGPNSWPDALSHQYQVYAAAKADPIGLAERIAWECDQAGGSFLRWNGGGDLFEESLVAIDHLSNLRPDLQIWVVTRTPDLAAKVIDRPNVFIHFSLDRNSMARREQFLKANPLSKNYFFSYQCEADEVPSSLVLSKVSVLFFNDYKFTCAPNTLSAEIVCPLNGSSDIRGTCESCRRCFDGSAVAHCLGANLAISAPKAGKKIKRKI
jgi:hypothetical protein